MRYSKQNNAFYPKDIFYPDLPDDLIEITQEIFDAALLHKSKSGLLDVKDGTLILVPLAPNVYSDFENGVWIENADKKAAFLAEQLLTRLRARQADAKTALAISDTTIIRCAEKGVAVPDAWGDYRDELRKIIALKTIINEAELPVLPPRPAFPEGT